MAKLNMLNELVTYPLFFHYGQNSYKEITFIQNLSSKQIRIHLNNLLLDPRL